MRLHRRNSLRWQFSIWMLWYRQCQVTEVLTACVQIYEKTLWVPNTKFIKLNINASIVPTKLTLLWSHKKKIKGITRLYSGRTPKNGNESRLLA